MFLLYFNDNRINVFYYIILTASLQFEYEKASIWVKYIVLKSTFTQQSLNF